MTRILSGELSSIMSEYLLGGYRNDQINFEWFEVSADAIVGSVSVDPYYLPPTGQFHFTAPLAFVAVAQLAIVYAHIDLNRSKKNTEVLVRRINLVFNRPVEQSTDIRILLSLSSKRRTGDNWYYAGKIDVSDGAFHGYGSFIIPNS